MNDWQLWNFGIRKHVKHAFCHQTAGILVKVALIDLIDGKVTEEEENLSNRK
jgi:hypothetical protein